MAEQVIEMCDQLIKAVNVMMDPGSNQQYRLEALKFCEDFKEKCPYCVQCGLQLSDRSQDAVIRHFGLQILEHVIKFRWNDMAQEEKVHLKNCAMELLSKGTRPILEEESHIKDALSRIVVEMIKREWPQNWPNMLKEMETLTSMGEAQAELVMLILLRLAEDVITFQTLPTQRRRDIQQTLTQNMESIFSFFLTILQAHVDSYRKLKSIACEEAKARAHCRVAVATLNTLAGYIDWVSVVHITNGNCHLLEVLCLLLNEPELHLEAAECVLIAISRKGKLEDRRPLMVLFEDNVMNYILSAVQSADGAALCNNSTPKAGESTRVVERHYTFVKRLCQVFSALGSQLCALVVLGGEVEVPRNLNKYLESFLAFSSHPSQFVKSSTQMTWGSLFRHEILSKDPVVVQMAVNYLRVTMTNLVKIGFPSKNDSPSCEYSQADFDSDEDFNSFFNSFRAQQGENVRLACRLAPGEAFLMTCEWLKFQIMTPIDTGNATSKIGGLCSVLSPSAVQWDAMTFFSESVVGQVFKIVEKERLPIQQGVELLQMVLTYETNDPLILSCVLTNISSLFPFATHHSPLLPQVLAKLFASITFDIQVEQKGPRTRAVKNVRRHACSSIVKICRDYPQFILPCFDMFYAESKKLLSNELLLTQMERCTLMEALVLISNQFKDYNKQEAFLKELLAPIRTLWLSDEMKSVVWDPVLFLAFVGADQVVTEKSSGDQFGINRLRLSFCVYTLVGVVKRARWPSCPHEAAAGGFVAGQTPSGEPIYRNPASAQVLMLLPNLLGLIRTLNSLFLTENVARLSETFARVHDIMDADKNLVLGLPQPVLDAHDSPVFKTVLERMQGFFSTLYENCFHVLGNLGPALQQDFYTVNGLPLQIINSVLSNLDSVPDHRLRPFLRVFMKQLVLSCPQEHYESLVCPLIRPLLAHMLQRLTLKWQVINQHSSLGGSEEENVVLEESQVTQELVEEHLVRIITKELLDLIISSCTSRKAAEPIGSKEEIADNDGEEMMATESSQGIQINSTNSTEELLSDLGKCFLKQEDIYMALLTITFTSLSWKDTSICQRTASLVCWSLLRQVTTRNLLPDAVTWLFFSVLKGLQIHGQHEGCSSTLTQLALLMYENLRPHYVELQGIMAQIPNIQLEDLDQFDQRLLNPGANKVTEKKKKEQFKKLIAGAIGKPLGQQFKKEVHIRNLPSLFKVPKADAKKDLLQGSESPGLTALFSPHPDRE